MHQHSNKNFQKDSNSSFQWWASKCSESVGSQKICKFKQDTFGLSNWHVLVVMTIHSGEEDVLMETHFEKDLLEKVRENMSRRVIRLRKIMYRCKDFFSPDFPVCYF